MYNRTGSSDTSGEVTAYTDSAYEFLFKMADNIDTSLTFESFSSHMNTNIVSEKVKAVVNFGKMETI